MHDQIATIDISVHHILRIINVHSQWPCKQANYTKYTPTLTSLSRKTNKRVVNEIKIIHNVTSGMNKTQQFTTLYKEEKRKEGKCRDFTCNSKADKISLVYHTNQTKKMKRAKQKKTDKQLSPEMVIKIREICPKRWGTLWREGFMEKVSLTRDNTFKKAVTPFDLPYLRTPRGKSSESVQCAVTGPCLRMHHRPSA